MTGSRRGLVLLGLTVAVILGASLPASADYSDAVPINTTVGTLAVAAPATVTINDSCTTATTVVKRTVYTNPGTGEQIQTAYSSTTTYAGSTTNVNSTTTTTAPGPYANETTTTTTTKNTSLAVTVSWTASGSRGVSGYLVKAYLFDGSAYTMAQTAPGTLTTSQTVDADNLSYQPRLAVTTLTSYGWTAETPRSAVLTC